MKNKISLKHILFVLICAFFIMLISETSSFAEDYITLTSTIKKVTNPVTNTFTYKIESDPSNPTNDLTNGKTFDVVFNKTQPNDSNIVSIKYKIDFHDVNFSSNGTYKFVVSEVSSSDPDTFPINDEKYEIYVYVERLTSGDVFKLVPQTGLSLKENIKKELVYNHDAKFTHIDVESKTHPIVSSKEGYFKYKVIIHGNPGDKYVITGQDPTVYYEGSVINTANTYTVKEGEENFVYVYLKDNQTVTIGLLNGDIDQIPYGTTFEIIGENPERWNTVIEEVTEPEARPAQRRTGYITAVAGAKITIDNYEILYVALYDIFINIIPFILLIVIGALGIILLRKIKESEDENNEETE